MVSQITHPVYLLWCSFNIVEARQITAFIYVYMGHYVWKTKAKNVNETALLLV